MSNGFDNGGDGEAEEKGPDAEAEAEEKKEEQTQAEEADDGDDAEAEEEDMNEKSEHLTEGDLEKSLEALETLIDGDDTTSRKQELLSKAQGDDISDEEKDELFQLLGKSDSDADSEPSLSDDLRKGFDEDEDIVQALDVSAFLKAQHEALTKSMDVLSEHVEGRDKRQHEFNIVLANAVAQTGKLVKSMADKLGVALEQPAREPKSQGVQGAQPLNKSFHGDPAGSGGPAGGGQLEDMTKSEVLDTLQSMLEKSVDAGEGPVAKCGEDFSIAIAKYDGTMDMSPQLLEEMQAFRAAQ